jgi:transcriptional regulator with XRE-family HTH domain
VKDFQDKDFRDQFFRTEREIDIPAQIKALRKLRKLNQEELAELVGTKQSAISRLERSQEAKFELETLVRLAEALDARLAVVIEPYETVIARYRSEQVTAKASAASAVSETRQRIPKSVSETSIPTYSYLREQHGTSSRPKQPSSLSDISLSPDRTAVLA